MPVTWAVWMLISAMALFSCRVTKALAPVGSMVMYSGSTSCAGVAPGPKMRTPSGMATPPKSTVCTGSCGSIGTTRMMLTVPSGSMQPAP